MLRRSALMGWHRFPLTLAASAMLAITACGGHTGGTSAPQGPADASSEGNGGDSCASGACPADAAASDACNGGLVPTCDNGVISTFCCPQGADCGEFAFCDLGGGKCALGSCPDGASPDASPSDSGDAE